MKRQQTLVSIFLFSCVNIGYQKFNIMSGGYKDKPLGDGEYFISYEMYGRIDPNLVLERWHMRAKELCPNGYEIIRLSRNDVHAGGVLVSSDKVYEGAVMCNNQ